MLFRTQTGWSPSFWHGAGVCEDGARVADEESGDEAVEDEALLFGQGTGFKGEVGEEVLRGEGEERD